MKKAQEDLEGGESELKSVDNLRLTEVIPREDEYDQDDPHSDESKRELMKHKYVANWRDNHSLFGAFIKGKLRKNDYHIILSFFICIVILFIMGLSVSISYDDLIGVTICVPFLHYGLAIFSLFRMINTDSPLAIWELIMFIFAYVVHYGWGAFYLIWEWDLKDFKYDPNEPSSFG